MSRGDHIRVRRGVYWHHGVDRGDGTVIHYDGSPRRPNGRVSITSREAFSRGRPVEVAWACPPEEADEVVARAEARLGEACYDLVSNNCEHFASWCTTGEATSRQVKRVADAVAVAAAASYVALSLLGGRKDRPRLPGA